MSLLQAIDAANIEATETKVKLITQHTYDYYTHVAYIGSSILIAYTHA